MKKALSLLLSLLMLVSLLMVPVSADADDGFNDGQFGEWGDGETPVEPPVEPDEPNGTKANPYPIGRPIDVPQSLELEAGACVYYQFPALKFNNWTLTCYSLTGVEVNGVMKTDFDLISRAIKIALSSEGDLVGFYNESEEAVTAVLDLAEPLGTDTDPYRLEAGENAVTIPEIHYEFFAEYVTEATGEHTFDVSDYENFEVYFDADRYDTENELVQLTEALTLELESGVPVAFVLRPINGVFDVTLSVTPPKKGTEQNPYWLFGYEDIQAGVNGDGLWPADNTYYMLGGEYAGYPLVVSGTGPLSVTVNGTPWTKDGTGAVSLEIPLELGETDWSFQLLVKGGSDVKFDIVFPVGHEKNPLPLNKGQNTLPLDEWGNAYYAIYTAEKDGVLVMKPNTIEGLGYAEATNQTMKEDGTYDSDFIAKGWDDGEGNIIGASDDNILTVPVKAGDKVLVLANAGENEDFEILAMNWVLTVGYEGETELKITTEPATAAYAKEGAKVSVKITAVGDGLKYQWYIKNDGATKYSKSSVTSATYSTTMSDKAHGRRIYCVVTDEYGNSVQSKTFMLRRQATITKEPATAAYAQMGKTVSVKITAVGDGLKYQWYIKNAGATKYSKSSITSATYSATMSSKVEGRRIYCVVKDKYGKTVQSKTFILRESVSITSVPATSAYAKNGATVKVTIKAAGDGLKYTWYIKNAGGTKYTKSSITKATYSVKMSSKVNGRRVYCIVTDKYGNKVQTKTFILKKK